MPNRFCAICGKSLKQNSPHFNMCMDCYLAENPLFELPDSFSVKICKECGMYSKKEEWIESPSNDIFGIIEEVIEKFLLKKYIKSNEIQFAFSYDKTNFMYNSSDLLKSLKLIVHGKLNKNPKISSEQNIDVVINYELCNNCSNLISGMHFLSIIQLRVKAEDFFDVIADCLSEIQKYVEDLYLEDNRQYISKLVDQKYGVDLFLSTNELMKKIIVFLKPRYNFILKRSKKLVGRDSQKGRNLYRLKSLIKFIPFKRSDWIILNEKKFYVENVHNKIVVLRDEGNLKMVKNFNEFFDEKASLTVLRDEE